VQLLKTTLNVYRRFIVLYLNTNLRQWVGGAGRSIAREANIHISELTDNKHSFQKKALGMENTNIAIRICSPSKSRKYKVVFCQIIGLHYRHNNIRMMVAHVTYELNFIIFYFLTKMYRKSINYSRCRKGCPLQTCTVQLQYIVR
jgi:hypothetical protein